MKDSMMSPSSKVGDIVNVAWGVLLVFTMIGSLLGHYERAVHFAIIIVLGWSTQRIAVEALNSIAKLTHRKDKTPPT